MVLAARSRRGGSGRGVGRQVQVAPGADDKPEAERGPASFELEEPAWPANVQVEEAEEQEEEEQCQPCWCPLGCPRSGAVVGG